ncbi:hypothetical protein KUF71_004291 [Frankliniella fusca]|uniref:Uncharacterized protein n=1 Tax=Frankliniella fusca TaxID=407009 RepID=A0AAE1L8X6_9NEOP|nr:hypothetical protein KUF71_004291 [Frankliniella fusca]
MDNVEEQAAFDEEVESEEESTTEENSSSTGQGMDEPIYPGASITVRESLASILHIPRPNCFVKSKHRLLKMLAHLNDSIEVHHFCSICYKTRKSLTDLCDTCEDETRSVEFFITFPLAPQVRRMFQRPDFVQNLRFNQLRANNGNIEDISDGQLYRDAENQGQASGITFMWNTDGQRFLSENLLIGGIWDSTVKPHSNVYLLPIYTELTLFKQGIDVEVHGDDEIQKMICSVLCGTCDAPATASFLNIKSHSGFYSCPICITRGTKPGDSVVFPYEENVPLRNMVDYQEHVKLAVEHKVVLHKTIRNEERFCVVRGPTVLSKIVQNIFSSMAIDSMHCLYLGVTRQMLKLWFIDGKYANKAKLLSQKLLQLAPPYYMQRVPQAIEKIIHWKATEFRSFLFNLSMVVLKDLLEPEDYNHFSLFVKGVCLLNPNSISEDDLKESEIHLTRFVGEFEGLYGVNNMSHNLHMCLHLTHCVRLLGPLWAVSCFNFEDINGRILNLIHGTRHVGLQIHSKLSLITQLPITIHHINEGLVKEFCKNIKGRYRLNINYVISSGVYCVGKFSELTTKKGWIPGFLQREISILPSTKIMLFHRLLKYKMLFVSSLYKRSSRVSSYVSYDFNNTIKYGNILCFVKNFCNCSKQCVCVPQYVAVVKPVVVNPFCTDDVVFNHLMKCEASNPEVSFSNCNVVPEQDLQCVLFKLESAGVTYLAAPLNRYELE